MSERLVEIIGIAGQRVAAETSDRASREGWNPNYLGDSFHIEEYEGDAANVAGRVRLAPTTTASLQREIDRTPDVEQPRPARSATMQARLANARRDVQRRLRAS